MALYSFQLKFSQQFSFLLRDCKFCNDRFSLTKCLVYMQYKMCSYLGSTILRIDIYLVIFEGSLLRSKMIISSKQFNKRK